MRARIKRLNDTIISLNESLRTENDNVTADESIMTTRSADDSDVHMKTLSDIDDFEADNFNGHTEPNANNIAFPFIQNMQPVNGHILNFDNSPPTFANAQANIDLINQRTIPNAGDIIQELNNNNPNMISFNVERDNLRSYLNPTSAQTQQYNFNMITDSVQPNSNHTFYAQNYVNTRGNNNAVCSVIPCNKPPICAPRINTSCISAAENNLQSIITEASNNNYFTNNPQQFTNLFGEPNLNSNGTVIRIPLNRIQETLRNKICNVITNKQSNDSRRNIQTETGTQKETANTIAPTTNVVAKSSDTSNIVLNPVPNNGYKAISRRSSSDSNELIIDENRINSTEAAPEDTTKTQGLIKISDDFSPKKRAVILQCAVSESQKEIVSNDNTTLSCRNNTQCQKNLQSESNLESQNNLESQSYLQYQLCLKTQSSLESQPTGSSTNNSIIKFKIKKRDNLLLEALKVKGATNTNGKDCQKGNTTPSSRHSNDPRRQVKESKESLTDCNSMKKSTNKESLTSAIVVNSSTKEESKSSARRKESTPKSDTVLKENTAKKCTLTHQLTLQPTGTINFKEGDTGKSNKENRDTDKSNKENHEKQKSQSSKRKKTDDDQNGKEKLENSKKMDIGKKKTNGRQNYSSYYNLTSATNGYQVYPRNYYGYYNSYGWQYDNKSYYYPNGDDVRCYNDITYYGEVDYNYTVPEWPYDTTANYRRNQNANKKRSRRMRTKKSNIPEKKE